MASQYLYHVVVPLLNLGFSLPASSFEFREIYRYSSGQITILTYTLHQLSTGLIWIGQWALFAVKCLGTPWEA